jgi:VanZ family protein
MSGPPIETELAAEQLQPRRIEKMRWLKQWWPVLAWAALISWLSTGTFTAENTGKIIIPILRWIFYAASPETITSLHYFIRKSGHFVEYFVLSLLILRALRAGRRRSRLGWAFMAIALVAGYAALDEFHQSFVPGRTASVADVLLDTAGGIAAQILAALVTLLGDVRARGRAGKVPPAATT